MMMMMMMMMMQNKRRNARDVWTIVRCRKAVGNSHKRRLFEAKPYAQSKVLQKTAFH